MQLRSDSLVDLYPSLSVITITLACCTLVHFTACLNSSSDRYVSGQPKSSRQCERERENTVVYTLRRLSVAKAVAAGATRRASSDVAMAIERKEKNEISS